jgi:hypothetical protein
LITSGGCSLFSILAKFGGYIDSIDSIDMNVEQNYLAILKLYVVEFYNDIDNIFSFFDGKFSKETYNIFIDQFMLCKNIPNNTKKFWDANRNFIYDGINISGKFELLFKQYIDNDIANYSITEKIFSRKNLISIFGESAVVNSMNQEFYNHFYNVFLTYNIKYKNSEDNYFYNTIKNGIYSKKDYPHYFNNINNLIKNKHKIKYISESFIKYIENINKLYDFIDVSNIFDWMNYCDVIKLIHNIYEKLNYGGCIIARRLNGDYNLHKLLSTHFKIIENIPEDKSFFYSEIIIGIKSICV